ncbi:Probablequinone oxidoreductase 1 [Hordeum vulgare]|nr:Probablequinone oxidoreductase 1 [Hordeum vulgare]
MDGSSAEVMVKRAKTVLTVAAIPGSLRRASANTGLIRAAAKMCEESIPGLRIDHVDISDLPLLNTDLENVDGNAFPATVEDRSKFDDEGNLIDPETGEMLRKILLSLQAFALRLIHGNSAAKSGQGS